MASVDVAQGRYAWIEPGVFEVAPGVHRIPLPMRNDGLRAVNVYAIEDGDGLVLVDSGWALDEARAALESAVHDLGYELTDIRRFLITHMHRDHYTLGVLLRESCGARVSLGTGERPSMELLVAGAEDDQLGQLERSGATELVQVLREARDADLMPPADHYESPDDWIDGPTEIELESRTLLAIPTPGHTRGHLVFLDQENSLLFSGDHVLPHITPSIGLEPSRSELPLGDYLDSLRLMHTYADARMLPAHGPVVRSVHGRVNELLEHHESRLEQTAQAISAGAVTISDAARGLGWTRRDRAYEELDLLNQILAIGETAAHLDLLVARGALSRSIVDGVVRYRAL